MLLIPVLSRLPRPAAPALVLLFVAGLASEVFLPAMRFSPESDPFFWEFRSPLRWWGYFVAGWVLAQHSPRIHSLPHSIARHAGFVALLLVEGLFTYYAESLPPQFTWQGAVIQYAIIYCTIAAVVSLSLGTAEYPVVRWISDATCPLYLYHPFSISACHAASPRDVPGIAWVSDGLAFVFGLAGASLVVLVGRRVLGQHARILLG